MDGNGRWAKKRGMPRSAGHTVGAANFKTITRYCAKIGIEYLTVYAFSTENGKRSAEEVSALMDLFEENFIKPVCLRVFAAIPLRVRSRSFRFVHAGVPPYSLRYVRKICFAASSEIKYLGADD